MTNALLQVAMLVLWSTNQMDTLLSPVGDDIIRSTITMSNSVPVLTNSVRLRRAWMKVESEFPPVPDLSQITAQEFYRGSLTNNAYAEVPRKERMAVIIQNETAGPLGKFRDTIGLEWDEDTNNVPDVFKLYTSTNLTLPLTNWTLVAEVSGNVHNVTLSNIVLQQAWFFLTKSNWWGESGPSNVAGTPPIPSDEHELRIGP